VSVEIQKKSGSTIRVTAATNDRYPRFQPFRLRARLLRGRGLVKTGADRDKREKKKHAESLLNLHQPRGDLTTCRRSLAVTSTVGHKRADRRSFINNSADVRAAGGTPFFVWA